MVYENILRMGYKTFTGFSSVKDSWEFPQIPKKDSWEILLNCYLETYSLIPPDLKARPDFLNVIVQYLPNDNPPSSPPLM